ncbi:Protein-S-isoprenylcysteine O-methyltransferase Ste14 [Gillisia sp. Hel1_33_143]|uniref:methyltransferase family protein n=1 Tax=Gillisia sp. Hel1_33_143 TaxID=1336796 RepID=UPI00087B1BD3|nr:isoprenylcysteine carboxylmethyltransferase family protein [Gillisia sp. Hel1_33_143]SDS44960.1 Protein-S-isoprenylcysteine O-methyltransferase Ste14 [Gillisia sp. Hel1_33_143]
MITEKDWMYVLLQFILFGVYLIEIDLITISMPEWFKLGVLTFSVLGIIIIVLSFYQLGSNLSPFPSPVKNADLITTGIFKYLRHPIYTGILLILFSVAIYNTSEYKLIISILLLILFQFKSKYEESRLIANFENYKDYMKDTGKFIPKL